MEEHQNDQAPEGVAGEDNVVDDAVLPDYLGNNVVRQVFFENCNLEDLRRLRLVCKEFYNLTLKRFRDNFIVKISEDVANGKWRFDHSLGFHNVDLLSTLPQIQDVPLRRFDISIKTRPQEDYEDLLVQYLPSLHAYVHFWDTFGTWIHHLKLNVLGDMDGWTLGKWLVEKTPNLESFNLNAGMYVWDQDDLEGLRHEKLEIIEINCLVIPWREVLETFPNLKKIRINNLFERDAPEILAALRTLAGNNGIPRKLELQNVYINGCRQTRDLLTECFNFTGIRLQDFKLGRILDVQGFQDCLTLLLNNMTGSSQTLCLSETVTVLDPIQRLFPIDRTVISKLTIDCRLVPNLDFLANLPNLAEASFTKCSLANFDQSNDQNVIPLHHLKTVSIEINILTILRSSDIAIVAAYAPHLVDFSGRLDNASFATLCTLLTDIRHLNITLDASASELDDEGITGILEGGTRDGGEVLTPNLTNLTNLRTFRCGSCNLSDGSVWNAFLKLDHLQTVDLYLSQETSNAAFFELFSKFPSQTVRRDWDGCDNTPEAALNKRLKKVSKDLHYYCGI